MSFDVIIPARYSSTRLPAKALAEIEGRPLIAHVVSQVQGSEAESIIVATDDERIADALKGADCEVVMTSKDHQSGSDRLAEVVALKQIDAQRIVVNVQGDEPMIPPRLINEVAACLADNADAVMSTAAKAFAQESDVANPNMVKVVLNQRQEALYFSRSAIPFFREKLDEVQALHHIGIYAYRAGFLSQFSHLAPTPLESVESLEQLRVLESGSKIAVHKIDYDAGLGVDTQEDLDRVRQLMALR